MADQKISFHQEIPVIAECDVFIAGGGPAGCAAAWGASKSAASVFLAERGGCFGGMGTAGLVPAFTGHYDGRRMICGGFGAIVFERMKACGEMPGNPNAIQPEKLKQIYDTLMAECKIDFAFESEVIGVCKNADNCITEAVISTVEGLRAVRAKTYIDATGDGSLARAAGAAYEIGDEMGRIMPASLCSSWSNIDWEEKIRSGADERELQHAAIREKRYFKIPDYHMTGMSPSGTSTASGNIGHIFGVNPISLRSRTAAWLEGRRILPEYGAFYRENVPGFEHCELNASASLLGVRESCRICGEYQLTREDYYHAQSFPDSIGVFHYGIDIHPYDNSPEEWKRFKDEFYEPKLKPGVNCMIPYRVLCVKDFRNLLTAGRCISTDHYAEASLRVMPTCFVTGQAAGCAATLSAQTGCPVKSVDVTVLQGKLKQLGAILE